MKESKPRKNHSQQGAAADVSSDGSSSTDFKPNGDAVTSQPKRLSKSFYETELQKLYVELVKLQEWIRHHGLHVVVVFEGRDAAGKGGTIKRIIEPLNPRVCRVVALGLPPNEKRSSGIFNDMSLTFPPLERWSCSTAVGTTAPASNARWGSAAKMNTYDFHNPALNSSTC